MVDSSIRRAGPDDAQTLAELGRDTFVATFAHLYPPEDLMAYIAETYTQDVFRAALEDPAHGLWIAQAGDQAIAYIHAGPCSLPHPDVTPGCGEVKRLYVRREHQSGGHGAALFTTALDWLVRPGRRLWIGVWSQNHGAQRFYGRFGFEKIGEYIFPVGNTRDHEFILRRG